MVLVRSSCLDLLCLRAAITRYNPRLDCLQLYSGHHVCKELAPAEPSHAASTSNSTSTASTTSSSSSTSASSGSGGGGGAEDLAGFLRLLLDLAEQLHRLHFDPQELALFAALLVLSSGIAGEHLTLLLQIILTA